MQTDTMELANCNFLTCEISDVMTDTQKRVVTLYSVVCSLLFSIVLALTVYYLFAKQVRKLLGFAGFNKNQCDHTKTASPSFKKLTKNAIYIPTVTRKELVDPLICVTVDHLPECYRPFSILQEERNGSVFNSSSVRIEEFGDHIDVRNYFAYRFSFLFFSSPPPKP